MPQKLVIVIIKKTLAALHFVVFVLIFAFKMEIFVLFVRQVEETRSKFGGLQQSSSLERKSFVDSIEEAKKKTQEFQVETLIEFSRHFLFL